MHEYTVNTKKAIYITFRVRGHRDSSLLATIRITALDPNFEFDYKGSVPHEVIDKMEETCSAIQTLAGAKAENAYFCACVARNELLNWCCGGMTQATSSFTSAIARNQDEEDPHDDDEEEPEEVPREVPHVDEAVSSTTADADEDRRIKWQQEQKRYGSLEGIKWHSMASALILILMMMAIK